MSELVMQPSFRAVGQTHAKIRDKRICKMPVYPCLTDMSDIRLYFRGFQMSTIPPVFGQQL